MKRIKTVQINNLKIIKRGDTFLVKTPDGRFLEEFKKEEKAISFAEKTFDFTKKRNK
jgi:hypothetical protein